MSLRWLGQALARLARHVGGLLRAADEQQDPRQRVRGGRRQLGLGERPARLVQVRRGGLAVGPRLGEAELKQHARLRLRIEWLLDHPAEVRDGALGRSAGRCGGAGVGELLGDPGLPARRRREELRGDLLGRGAGVVHQLRRSTVLELALGRRDALVDGGPDERVGEPQRRAGAEDLGVGEPAGDPRDVVDLVAAEGGDRGQLGAIADDRHRARHLGRLRRQARKALLDRPRDGAGADVGDRRRHAGDGLDALELERAEELAQEQRVAPRRSPARLAELLLGLAAEPLGHELADGARTEVPEADRHRRGIADEVRHEGRIGAGVGAAQPGHDAERRSLQPMGEVGEEPQRRPVAPVQVVDDQDGGLLAGEVLRHPVEPVQDGEGDVATRRRLLVPGREDRVGGRGGVGEGRGAPGLRPQASLEELADDAEGEVDLELAAAGREDLEPARVGSLADRPEQGALADPRRPLHRDHAAARVGDQIERGERCGELTVALDEGLGRRAHESSASASDSSPRELISSLR